MVRNRESFLYNRTNIRVLVLEVQIAPQALSTKHYSNMKFIIALGLDGFFKLTLSKVFKVVGLLTYCEILNFENLKNISFKNQD